MFEAAWIKIDDESSWVAGEYKTLQTTEVMQMPGGIVLKTSRADFLKNGKPATSSCSMIFIPYVTFQVIEGRVLFDSTSAEAAAHMGEVLVDTMQKQLRKRGL
jgi:hypothetical protein